MKVEETDRRLLERRVKIGKVSDAAFSEYLATIPDASENAEEVTVVMEERKQA